MLSCLCVITCPLIQRNLASLAKHLIKKLNAEVSNHCPFHFILQDHASRGANVLRVFTHSNFDSPEAMMPEFGVYNEDALKRLDLTMVAASQNGIRLIMVMANYWPFLGGKLLLTATFTFL